LLLQTQSVENLLVCKQACWRYPHNFLWAKLCFQKW